MDVGGEGERKEAEDGRVNTVHAHEHII